MYWAIKRKEKTMRMFLSTNLPELLIEKKKSRQQSTLDTFLSVSDKDSEEYEKLKVTDKISIVIDSREAFGQIPKLLKEMGANISSQKLDCSLVRATSAGSPSSRSSDRRRTRFFMAARAREKNRRR